MEEATEATTTAPTPSMNPVNRIESGKLKVKEGGYTEVLSFLRTLSFLDRCPALLGKRVDTGCTCMHALRPKQGGIDSFKLRMVASFVCYYGRLDNNSRRLLEIQWIKKATRAAKMQASTTRLNYFLLVRSTEEFEEEALSPAVLELQKAVVKVPVCANAFKLVYGLGRDRFRSSQSNAANNTFPSHGLKGRKGKDSNRKTDKIQEAEKNLEEFLLSLHDEGEEVEDLVELPHYFSKRSLYSRWCFECGWIVKTDAKGNNTYKAREPSDDDWSADMSKPYLNWKTFRRYWEEHHPNLKIRAQSSEDNTCGGGECRQVVAM